MLLGIDASPREGSYPLRRISVLSMPTCLLTSCTSTPLNICIILFGSSGPGFILPQGVSQSFCGTDIPDPFTVLLLPQTGHRRFDAHDTDSWGTPLHFNGSHYGRFREILGVIDANDLKAKVALFLHVVEEVLAIFRDDFFGLTELPLHVRSEELRDAVAQAVLRSGEEPFSKTSVGFV